MDESPAELGVWQGCLRPSAYIGGVIPFSSRLEGPGAECGLAAGSGVVGYDGEGDPGISPSPFRPAPLCFVNLFIVLV